MNDTSPPDALPTALSAADLAVLLLSQERVARVTAQIELVVHRHAELMREREALVAAAEATSADICARYMIGAKTQIDQKTGAFKRE